MKGISLLLLAMLQCSGLACGQAQNCTGAGELQSIYTTFAQNLAAFNVFLELLPVRVSMASTARVLTEPGPELGSTDAGTN